MRLQSPFILLIPDMPQAEDHTLVLLHLIQLEQEDHMLLPLHSPLSLLVLLLEVDINNLLYLFLLMDSLVHPLEVDHMPLPVDPLEEELEEDIRLDLLLLLEDNRLEVDHTRYCLLSPLLPSIPIYSGCTCSL